MSLGFRKIVLEEKSLHSMQPILLHINVVFFSIFKWCFNIFYALLSLITSFSIVLFSFCLTKVVFYNCISWSIIVSTTVIAVSKLYMARKQDSGTESGSAFQWSTSPLCGWPERLWECVPVWNLLSLVGDHLVPVVQFFPSGEHERA